MDRERAEDAVLGLDVGGTKLAAGVVTADGRVRSMLVEASHSERGPLDMIARHLDLGRRAVAASGIPWAEIRTVGIACGGPLDPVAGVIQSPPGLPGWDGIPLAALVSDEYDRPTVVDNDATAGAMAEWSYGAGRGRSIRDLVYLTISTGIGGGLILDGRVYRGAAANAGELGHLTVDRLGRTCGCGRRGCLEAYASGSSIARRAREAIAEGAASALGDLGEVTARDVSEAAAAGDPLAARIWDETTAILGSAIANILDIFNPELVVLGGGVTRAGARLLDPVRKEGLAQAMAPAREAGEVVLSVLGDAVGVVGAASLAFDASRTVGARTASGAPGSS